jgi:hypothetical protein
VNTFAQGFINLDFENTTLTPASVNGISYTATISGWTWSPIGNFGTGDPSTVALNGQALDNSAVTLQSSTSYIPAIQGNYSVFLQGGSPADEGQKGASIGQTGQIPVGTQSIIYWETPSRYPSLDNLSPLSPLPVIRITPFGKPTLALTAAKPENCFFKCRGNHKPFSIIFNFPPNPYRNRILLA